MPSGGSGRSLPSAVTFRAAWALVGLLACGGRPPLLPLAPVGGNDVGREWQKQSREPGCLRCRGVAWAERGSGRNAGAALAGMVLHAGSAFLRMAIMGPLR